MSPRAGGREAAEPGGDRLRPRLELPEVARGEDDAALDRRLAQTRDEHLAHDDRGDHPRGRDVLADEHDEHSEDEHLVGDRVEERAER